MVVDPADGCRHILDMRRVRHRRRKAVIGGDEDDALFVEEFRLVADFALVAFAPFAAVKEDHDRCAGRAAGAVDVQALQGVFAIGAIRQDYGLVGEDGPLRRARPVPAPFHRCGRRIGGPRNGGDRERRSDCDNGNRPAEITSGHVASPPLGVFIECRTVPGYWSLP